MGKEEVELVAWRDYGNLYEAFVNGLRKVGIKVENGDFSSAIETGEIEEPDREIEIIDKEEKSVIVTVLVKGNEIGIREIGPGEKKK